MNWRSGRIQKKQRSRALQPDLPDRRAAWEGYEAALREIARLLGEPVPPGRH